MLAFRGSHSEAGRVDVKEIVEKILALSSYKIDPLLKKNSLFTHLALKTMMANELMELILLPLGKEKNRALGIASQ